MRSSVAFQYSPSFNREVLRERMTATGHSLALQVEGDVGATGLGLFLKCRLSRNVRFSLSEP